MTTIRMGNYMGNSRSLPVFKTTFEDLHIGNFVFYSGQSKTCPSRYVVTDKFPNSKTVWIKMIDSFDYDGDDMFNIIRHTTMGVLADPTSLSILEPKYHAGDRVQTIDNIYMNLIVCNIGYEYNSSIHACIIKCGGVDRDTGRMFACNELGLLPCTTELVSLDINNASNNIPKEPLPETPELPETHNAHNGFPTFSALYE